MVDPLTKKIEELDVHTTISNSDLLMVGVPQGGGLYNLEHITFSNLLPNGIISTARLANYAVTGPKIANEAIVPAKTSFMNSNGADAGIFVGKINSGGTAARLPSGWSVSGYSNPGVYEITHNLGTTGFSIVAQILQTGNLIINIYNITTTKFTAQVRESHLETYNPKNAAWSFILIVY